MSHKQEKSHEHLGKTKLNKKKKIGKVAGYKKRNNFPLTQLNSTAQDVPHTVEVLLDTVPPKLQCSHIN